MLSPIERIKNFYCRDAEYINDNREYIQRNNNRVLQKSCIIYMFVLIAYTFFTYFANDSKMLLWMYIIFDFVNIGISLIVIWCNQKGINRYFLTQWLCAIFEFAFLAFFAIEGIFPYPETHSLYVPIAVFLVILLFDHGAMYVFSMVVFYTFFYGLGAYLFKASVAYVNDLMIAFATLVSTIIGYVLLSDIRHDKWYAIKKMEYMSTVDALTGIFNKASIVRYATEHIIDNAGKSDKIYAFAIVDIDNFKNINDNYGHHVGDGILHEFACILKDIFKNDDDCVGRFGGDEFVVVIDVGKNPEQSVNERIGQVLDRLAGININGFEYKLSCSVGIALQKTNGNETFNQLFERADKALYKVKNSEKGCFLVS